MMCNDRTNPLQRWRLLATRAAVIRFSSLRWFMRACAVVAFSGALSSCTKEDSAAEKGFVEIDWSVTKGWGVQADQHMRLRIPREYKTYVVSYKDVSRKEPLFTPNVKHGGVASVEIEAWLPRLTPRPAENVPANASKEQRRDYVSNKMLVVLRPTRGADIDGTRRFTVFQFKRGDLYRRPDISGLEWYVPMGCGERLPDVKTPKPADDLSPEGCREVYGDHEFLVPGKSTKIKCTSVTGGVCVYTGNPSGWDLEIKFAGFGIGRWQEYEKHALDLIDRFSVGGNTGLNPSSQSTAKKQ